MVNKRQRVRWIVRRNINGELVLHHIRVAEGSKPLRETTYVRGKLDAHKGTRWFLTELVGGTPLSAWKKAQRAHQRAERQIVTKLDKNYLEHLKLSNMQSKLDADHGTICDGLHKHAL